MTSAQLVPPNATFLERVMDDLASRISDVPADVISTIWNPETCPPDALPFLAWALSVDFWNPEWTEQTKREVVANAYQVHASKGTVGALKRALGPLGMRIALREWWEHGGPPHTFGVTATVQPGAPATDSVQRDLARIIEATKPARSHLTDLRIGAEFDQGLGIAIAAGAADAITGTGLAVGRRELVGASALISVVTAAGHQETPVGSLSGRQGLDAEAAMATVLTVGTGSDGDGVAVGRTTLTGEAAAALVVTTTSVSGGEGPAAGRAGVELSAPLVAVAAGVDSTDVIMPEEEPDEIMASRIVLAGASFPEMIITAIDGALVLIQGGKTTYLVGRPPQPDIAQVGLVTGLLGNSVVDFFGVDLEANIISPEDGILVPGDVLSLNAEQYTVEAVSGSSLTIIPPLVADLDGAVAIRIRKRG